MSKVSRLATVLVGVLLAACESAPVAEPPDPLTVGWQETVLPSPAGEPGRVMVRDATVCAGRWYLVGALGGPGDATRPAAWTSPDGRTWNALTVRPKSYWGRQNVLYSAACREGRLAAIGAKPGGAHGNPRVSSWYLHADALIEVAEPRFELYGGPNAVNVSRIAAGATGWLIAGNRSSGAAVWLSPDATRFEIVEAAPQLASDERGVSWAFDAAGTPSGWLLVGGILRPGRTDRDPIAWTSTDGSAWQRVSVPGGDEYDELQRVALLDGTPVAVGLRGRGFGAWRDTGDGWQPVGRFGAAAAHGVPTVRALAAADGRLVATVSDGAVHHLWLSADGGRSWRPMVGPMAMPAGAEQVATMALDGSRLLLAVDDGRGGRAWWVELGDSSR